MRTRVFMLRSYDRVRIEAKDVAAHGELTLVYPDGEWPPGVYGPAFVGETLHRMDKLGYDPRRDLFVIAGNMVPMVRVVGELCALWDVPVAVLAYDAQSREYVRIDVGGVGVHN